VAEKGWPRQSRTGKGVVSQAPNSEAPGASIFGGRARFRHRDHLAKLPITRERGIGWAPEKQLQILPLRVRMTAGVTVMTAIAMVRPGE